MCDGPEEGPQRDGSVCFRRRRGIEAKMSKKTLFLIGLALALAARPVSAQPKYDPGASDTEIKIGNVAPYSGPVSLYGAVGKVEAAFFKMVNDQGGINGRKINFISYDDAYSPPKTLEQTRRLVESDEVLAIFSPVGAPTNSAIQKYLNGKKIPHLFLASASTKWDDPKHFPWTMGMGTSYQSEGAIFARYIQREKPDAKIAVLYQNDDFGKDMLKGFLDALGEKGSMIVAKSSYEVSEPTIDSHVVTLKSSGADVLVTFATPKFTVQTVKKVSEIGWKPLHVVTSVSSSVGAVLTPAGFENAQGLVSATYLKDVLDPDSVPRPRYDQVSLVPGEVHARRGQDRFASNSRLLESGGLGSRATGSRGQSDTRKHHEAGHEPSRREIRRPPRGDHPEYHTG